MQSLARNFPRNSSEKDRQYRDPKAIFQQARAAGFTVVEDKDSFQIIIPGARAFASGDDQILPELVAPLRNIAELALEHRLAVDIEGHTDDKPISHGRFASNWELSTARAISVLRLFLGLGVPNSMLSASGRAEFAPVASNATEDGRALNRRIVLLVKPSAAGRR